MSIQEFEQIPLNAIGCDQIQGHTQLSRRYFQKRLNRWGRLGYTDVKCVPPEEFRRGRYADTCNLGGQLNPLRAGLQIDDAASWPVTSIPLSNDKVGHIVNIAYGRHRAPEFGV